MPNRIVPPDPKRLINGLRDTGYSFEVAVADLIDNSISADAKKIHLSLKIDHAGQISLRLIDDGHGMNMEELIDAMKYGSPEKFDPQSLSKFGLGMKTASTSFCRCLSVISRGVSRGPVYKAVWDLDHVGTVGQWELLMPDPDEDEIDALNAVCGDGTGTLVSWEKVDRLLKDNGHPPTARTRTVLTKILDRLKFHISMVYQRFLDPDDVRETKKIRIWVEEEEIKPWDPFCSTIISPAQEETVQVKLPDDTVQGTFSVRAFILPRREDFPDETSAQRALISNQRQGFYIYRENRLIHEGDWMGMFSMEPHFSLLRVEFSFTADLDDAFQVDIKKSRISLTAPLEQWVKNDFLPPVRREAEDRYRQGERRVQRGVIDTAHQGSNNNISQKQQEINKARVDVLNPETNQALVTNEQGSTTITLVIQPLPQTRGNVFVDVVDSIVDGLLWEPALISQNQAVRINKNHPYYQKVYLPSIMNRNASVGTIEGMDALLWSLSIAELKTINPSTKDYFEQLRYDVSRNLRKLVENLPEPPEVNLNGD